LYKWAVALRPMRAVVAEVAHLPLPSPLPQAERIGNLL
jgi:hypothetical protein